MYDRPPSGLVELALKCLRLQLDNPAAGALVALSRLGGRHGAWLLDTRAGPFVFKFCRETAATYLHHVASTLKTDFLYRDVLRPASKPTRLAREAEAMKAWMDLGVPVPELLGAWEGVGVAYRYVCGRVLRLVLEDEGVETDEKLGLLERLAASMYRRHQCAHRHARPELLIHPDPTVNNIIVSDAEEVWVDMDTCFLPCSVDELRSHELRIFSYSTARCLVPRRLGELAERFVAAYPAPECWAMAVEQVRRRRFQSLAHAAERRKVKGGLTKLEWAAQLGIVLVSQG